MSTQRTKMSKERTKLSNLRTKLAKERTNMADLRTKMSAHRSYMNAERTLSVWIRTSLSVMVFGIAIDRFSLMLMENGGNSEDFLFWSTPSAAMGAALVIISMIIVSTAAVKFIRFAKHYEMEHHFPFSHSMTLPVFYAAMVDLVGIVLFILMLDL